MSSKVKKKEKVEINIQSCDGRMYSCNFIVTFVIIIMHSKVKVKFYIVVQ